MYLLNLVREPPPPLRFQPDVVFADVSLADVNLSFLFLLSQVSGCVDLSLWWCGRWTLSRHRLGPEASQASVEPLPPWAIWQYYDGLAGDERATPRPSPSHWIVNTKRFHVTHSVYKSLSFLKWHKHGEMLICQWQIMTNHNETKRHMLSCLNYLLFTLVFADRIVKAGRCTHLIPV
jgi:hypothetical protein